MGQGITSSEAASLEASLRRSNFCNIITSIPYRIFEFFRDIVLYGPGVGRINTQKVLKHKVANINTSSGLLRFPIMKMPCFDLNFGFFSGSIKLNQGLQDIPTFLDDNNGIFPGHIKLETVQSYWILNYRRPKDVNGRLSVFCFIENMMDGLIYIYEIKDNQLIDYEKILEDYEKEIENLDFMERVEKEIVNIGSIGKFMDELEKDNEDGESCRKRIKFQDSSCCTGDVCFNENSTTIQRREDL